MSRHAAPMANGAVAEAQAEGQPLTAPAATLPAPLARLFRHSLREGRVHPLLHAVQRYRREVLP